MSRYQVTAPCVVHIPTMTTSGPALGTFYKDAFLPDDVPQEKIGHLLATGLIRDVDAPVGDPAHPDTPAGVNSRSTKGDLVDHGVALGDDRAELEAMTRDQLLDRYVRQS